MVINGEIIRDNISSHLSRGDYFIYYNTFKLDQYWTLYQVEGFVDGPTVPNHFIMARCIGSTCKSKDRINVVQDKVYRFSQKDARVGTSAYLIRNEKTLLIKFFEGDKYFAKRSH